MRIKMPQVDWYKTILGLMILVFGSLLLATTVIIPYIRDIKKQNLILNVEKTSHDKAKMRFEEETHRLNNLKKENARYINGFHNSFNPKAFTSGFGGAKLLEFNNTAQVTENEYLISDYNVTAGFDNPITFFDLLKTLDESNFIAKITYPIVLASKDGTIYTSFGINTYTLAPKTKRKPQTTEQAPSIKETNASSSHTAPKNDGHAAH